MNDQGQPTIVPISGLVIAFLRSARVCGYLDGAPDSGRAARSSCSPECRGIALGALRAAPVSEASISSDEAIAIAREDVAVEGTRYER